MLTAMANPERNRPPASQLGAEGSFLRETAALRPVVRAVVTCVLGGGKDDPDVEDCTHEALRRAFEGRARLREGEPIRPWLLGIARHVAIDARRKRRRERRDDGPASNDHDDVIHQLVDPGPAPDERADRAEQARRIAVALQSLVEAQREAMILFHVEGESYQHIAERLNVPMGTVATWLARGRRMLAEALNKVEP